MRTHFADEETPARLIQLEEVYKAAKNVLFYVDAIEGNYFLDSLREAVDGVKNEANNS